MISKNNVFKNISKLSNTQVMMPAGCVHRFGAKLYSNSTSLTLNTGTVGLNGLDSALVASTLYYVYIVPSGTSDLALVASQSAVAPTGYTYSRKVGAFYTDSTPVIFKMYVLGAINQTRYTAYLDANGVVVTSDGNFLASVIEQGSSPYGLVVTFVAGIFSSIPTAVTTIVDGVTTNTNVLSYTIGLTTTGFNIYRQAGAGANANQALSLVVSKTGVDALQPDWFLYN